MSKAKVRAGGGMITGPFRESRAGSNRRIASSRRSHDRRPMGWVCEFSPVIHRKNEVQVEGRPSRRQAQEIDQHDLARRCPDREKRDALPDRNPVQLADHPQKLFTGRFLKLARRSRRIAHKSTSPLRYCGRHGWPADRHMPSYSRNASAGSTRAARAAGTNAASVATTATITAAAARETGSAGPTP